MDSLYSIHRCTRYWPTSDDVLRLKFQVRFLKGDGVKCCNTQAISWVNTVTTGAQRYSPEYTAGTFHQILTTIFHPTSKFSYSLAAKSLPWMINRFVITSGSHQAACQLTSNCHTPNTRINDSWLWTGFQPACAINDVRSHLCWPRRPHTPPSARYKLVHIIS